ncbi:unnamed protein product, partial [Ectocarpus sp. 13 AM-2016]
MYPTSPILSTPASEKPLCAAASRLCSLCRWVCLQRSFRGGVLACACKGGVSSPKHDALGAMQCASPPQSPPADMSGDSETSSRLGDASTIGLRQPRDAGEYTPLERFPFGPLDAALLLVRGLEDKPGMEELHMLL